MLPALDIPRSLALAGLTAPMGIRAQIEWAQSLGLRAVTLDAASPEARPRDLGRFARRDLASLLRRNELTFAGVDLWIPTEHLTDPARSDRAMAALLDAADFAAEMASLTAGVPLLSTVLPPPPPAGPGNDPARDALRERAAARGVRVADHRWPQWISPEKPEHRITEPPESPIGVGIDPAAVFITQGPLGDPAAEVLRLGARIACARLTDVNATGRCAPGAPGGRLDVLAYSVALVTAGYRGHLAIDLRAVPDQAAAAQRAAAPR